jgi:hypothetical protein
MRTYLSEDGLAEGAGGALALRTTHVDHTQSIQVRQAHTRPTQTTGLVKINFNRI